MNSTPSETVSVSDRLRYQFDNLFSKGPATLIAGLGILSLLIIAVAAAFLSLTNINQDGADKGLSFTEAAWEAMMRTLDPGTMGGDTGWGYRLVMLLVTLGGIFVISTLIGVLSSGIEAKMDNLRKGRSRVIESDHTIILGFSEQIFTILSELVQANENQKNPCIVVLAEGDKVEMEDALQDRIDQSGLKKKTRIVCRTGSPIDLNDLRIASLNTARSIIVLSPDSENPDAEVIKSVLAITHAPQRRAEPFHITAELRDLRNVDVARVVGQDEVEWVLVGELIARIVAQTCRQSGLSVVYTELLDFGGDEIYFSEQPNLVGKTFGEALLSFEKNAVLGYQQGGQQVHLNPPMATSLQAGDRLIVVAADDDQINQLGARPELVQAEQIMTGSAPMPAPERTLILGWNRRGPAILRELDQYVAPGSQVLLVADRDNLADENFPTMVNQTLLTHSADTTDRRVLEALDLGSVQHLILLAYLDDISAQQADARTLITLLHLRDLMDRCHYTFTIVSEMLDIRNRNLAAVTRADDFIVSERLISLMLSQVSENKHLNAVFADLFDPEGSEVYLKPVEQYVRLGQPVNFYTLVEAARRRGEVAFGYRQQALSKDAGQAYGVRLNPAKSKAITFQPGDKVVLLAEG